ncbi:helicase-associated domain-containing protein [Kitasatospora sp. NPDC048540]|uniref:helicase-associated domain-containing protein n=1 Tax=Kitasatospora sp. NPDC048540 TaxID=3155634 RepID=UPI0033EE99B5
MTSARALKTWLTSRTPAQLTELLEQRQLPYTAGAGLEDPARLAEHLLTANSALLGMISIDQAELQALTATVELAEELHGPLPVQATGAAPAGFTGGRPSYRPAGYAVRPPDPAERAVPRAKLVDRLGPRVAPVLDRLAERALLLPPHGTRLTVPAVLHQRVGELRGLGRPLAVLLTAAYKAAEVRIVEDALGLPRAPHRDAAQRQIVDLLQDAAAVRRMVADAPADVLELLGLLLAGAPRLRTDCFVQESANSYSGAPGWFHFREGGSGDRATDWLAVRGLLVPSGPDLAELPYEIGSALRVTPTELDLALDPPVPGPAPALPAFSAGEAQAAATAAVSQVELVLRAVAAAPLAVRRNGGVAVRDTRRLAKSVGTDEPRTRLWLDLAANAGLIAPHRGAPPATRGRKPAPPPPARILPTERYDRWLAAPPADRLVPLIATWAATPEVFSHWPAPDDTPVALVTPQDPHCTALRRAVLEALALLPAGHGLGAAAGLGPARVEDLVEAARWHLPVAIEQIADPVALTLATLHEAEAVGVVAHGALTPVGHAVLALLRAGADRWFPAVPGTGPSLDGHPELARAVGALRTALAELVPAPLTTARFQADLTVVVPGQAAPELAELLQSVADRESDGHAVVWRIGAASVRRALDAGADAADLLARLTEASEGALPLPQTLDYLVKDTARTHGRVRVVRSTCCLRSDDEALVLELSKARALAGLGLRRIAPTVLISTASPADTLTALRRAGYAPVLEAETGTTVVERAPEERAAAEMPELDAARRYLVPGPGSPAALAAAVLG